MHGVYDYRLVAVSVAIAMLAAYAALDLASRVTSVGGKTRVFWLFGGATAMGSGIWAMHYVGMLALHMPMPVFYHFPTVLLSLVVVVCASAVSLYVVSREHMGWRETIFGSAILGAGIAAMHFIGMAAMRMKATVHYDTVLVAASIALAIAVSVVGLQLSFRVRKHPRLSRSKIFSALVMGSAIPTMHYTGMASANFLTSETSPDLSNAISISHLGIAVIAATSVIILLITIAIAFVERYFEARKATLEALEQSEAHFRNLAEAIPQIIWTAGADGVPDYYNRRWYEYAGENFVPPLGWTLVIHPDDLQKSSEKWTASLRNGNLFEVEYRLRRASDGKYLWYLGRAVPVHDSKGEIVKWFGVCTDINDQKLNQQTLEEQVRERTAELVAANQQLLKEMHEKQRAQSELNRQSEKLVNDLKEKSKRAALLRKMGELLQICSQLPEAFSIVLEFAPKIFPEFRGALLLMNDSRSHLEVVGGWAGHEPAELIYEPNSCWAMRTGRIHLVAKGEIAAICSHVRQPHNPYFCIPIRAQGEAMGVLYFESIEGAVSWSEDELVLPNSFAEQIGLSIANIRLREMLKRQSIRDPLTGAFNRRYLDEVFERELRRAERANQTVGVIMMDLDHFKNFNDTFGHSAGDVALQGLGSILLKHVRSQDVVCRYGGEEFIILLPGVSEASTGSRADEIRRKVKEQDITYEGRPLAKISVSAGVSAFPKHGITPGQLIAAADGALYAAKKAGRDRVEIAPLLAAGASGS